MTKRPNKIWYQYKLKAISESLIGLTSKFISFTSNTKPLIQTLRTSVLKFPPKLRRLRNKSSTSKWNWGSDYWFVHSWKATLFLDRIRPWKIKSLNCKYDFENHQWFEVRAWCLLKKAEWTYWRKRKEQILV